MTQDKQQSLRALDLLNFCNAGIQTGLGPFMAVFYTAVRHWHAGQIGTLIACQSLSGILTQSFVGNWIDESHQKRLITAVAGLTVAAAAIALVMLPGYASQVVVQLVIGLAVTVFPAATAAFALGMADKAKLAGRVARNETFTHSGNVIFAISAAIVGTMIALQGIFYAAAIFAAGMAVAVRFIKTGTVNYEKARGGDASEQADHRRAGIRDLFRDKRILTFTIGVVLFFAANAATLPLVGEILAQNKKGRSSAWQVSAAVIVAELVMVVVAIVCGKLANRWGRKRLFLIGFGFLVLRNGLTVFNHNEFYLIGLQALDGVAMGIYGVLLTLITADLARGTGRFNLLQGAVQSAMGLGGFFSNLLFGWVAKSIGFNASFLGLAAIAVTGGTLWQVGMAETKPEANDNEAVAAHSNATGT